jgi:hypothetical protein
MFNLVIVSVSYEKYYIILESMLQDLNYQGQSCNFSTKIYTKCEDVHSETSSSFNFYEMTCPRAAAGL